MFSKKKFQDLFKSFFHFFFKLIYGKIEVYDNDLSKLNVETKNINIESKMKI